MARFNLHNVPIRRKLTIIVMATTCVALLLACASFVTYEQLSFRQTMVRDLAITAQMIGDNSSASLSFNEAGSAETTLRSLNAEPHITCAVIYGRDGSMFAHYQRTNTTNCGLSASVPALGHRFEADYLAFTVPIQLAGETIGTVYLQSSLVEMRVRLHRYLIIVGLVMLGSLLAAFLLSRRLKQSITEPIFHLLQVTREVASKKNYWVRARKHGRDELGSLIDGFNEMLEQIQARDVELHRAQEELEQRVAERTQSLSKEVSERKQAEAALLRATTLLDESQGLARVGGWQIDLEKNSLFWTEATFRIHDTSSQEYTPTIDTALAFYAPESAPVIRAAVQEAIDHGRNFSLELELITAKGRRIWAHATSKVVSENGRPVRIVGAFQDITARKEAEAELAAAHHKLLDVSRQAGMAEVATGVLHNVGNVLNSVNVSATLVAERLRKSKTASLAKVVGLFREHESDLGAFLTQDARGQKVPAYLGQLSDHLAAEQAGLLQELASLQKNIDHVKEVVAMQQSYARVSGLTETVHIDELVEDTLRMNNASLHRHEVKVVREFAQTPPLVIDKHKTLQILVNLVRNATHACHTNDGAEKQMTLRIVRETDSVKVSVADNGVGIPPENLTRIFNHGFTTKKEGHGFGLHSSANAAKAMGGALSVHSEGIGRGATFTLELPLTSTKGPPCLQP